MREQLTAKVESVQQTSPNCDHHTIEVTVQYRGKAIPRKTLLLYFPYVSLHFILPPFSSCGVFKSTASKPSHDPSPPPLSSRLPLIAPLMLLSSRRYIF